MHVYCGGAGGCHVTVENTSTNSVNNTSGYHCKTNGGVAKFFAYSAPETYIQSRTGGTADLILQASGASNMRLFTNGNERLRITSGGLLKVNSTDGGSYHTIRLNTTTNNAIKDVLHVHSSVDGATAAAGYGVRLNFSGEQSNGNEYTYGGIAGLYHDGGANNGMAGESMRLYEEIQHVKVDIIGFSNKV